MESKELLSKLKPIIIIIILFSLAFFIRAEAANISGAPDQMKSYFQEDNGLPYFSEMDSYYNYRMTQDFLSHGYLGDTKINGTNWDLHSFFPPGRSAEYTPLIAYLTAFFYKIANLFGQIPLLVVSFWTSAIIASLCVIPAYFFIRGITNDYGGITAGILVAVSPFYFSHTFAGFFDTDMFNFLLPLLVVWFYSESITSNDSRRKMIFAVLAALSIAIFSLAWEGWWYIFYILVFATIIYMIISKYFFKMETIKSFAKYPNKTQWLRDQPVILPLFIFAALSVILVFLAWGGGAINSFLGPLNVNQLQASTYGTAYPNVYISVGELQIPTLADVLNDSGGLLVFALGILAIPLLFWRSLPRKPKTKAKTKRKPAKRQRKRGRGRRTKDEIEEGPEIIDNIPTPEQRKNYLFYFVILSIWLILTAYAFTKGIRFVEAFSLPISISAGIFVGFIPNYLGKYIKTPNYRTITMIMLVVLISYGPVSVAYATSNSIVPGTDDSMVNSLVWIKNNTSNNTVITSWWDFGHLFAVKADRPVTFDGGSQNNARAYWVGKALFTNNENLSAGILQMLASSGDQGPLTLENYTKDTGKSVEILDKILIVDKNAAQNIMTNQYGLTQEQAQNVLKYTHPDNSTPDIFITSLDMASKAGWWSYFGGWNFTTKTGKNFIYSVASANSTTINNNTVLIQGQNGVVVQINSSNVTAGLLVNSTQIAQPHRLIIVDSGKKTLDKVVDNQSTFSIILTKDSNGILAVALNRELEDSMFTRLFFLQGEGLTHFKLAHKEPSGQPEVIVWKVS
ncbi:MAG: STT3 domain-containing protein [Methanobacteriaceae archaeon]